MKALLAALLWAAAGAPAAATEVGLTRRPDKAYEVSGRFDVDASSAIVWSVLTDYERIPGFVSSMRSSHIRETHEDGSLLVEQEAVGGILFLSRTMRVLLEVRRGPSELRFTDIGREDFSVYEGSWEVRRSSASSAVSYRLLAAPRLAAPAFIVSRAMKRSAANLLEQVRAEIVRTSASRNPK